MTSGGIIFINRKSKYQEFFPLIQPLFPLGNDYFHQNNIDLHVEIIHCIQAIGRHWSREPITTLYRPSVFMLEFSGQLTTPHRFSYHTGASRRIIDGASSVALYFSVSVNQRPLIFNGVNIWTLKMAAYATRVWPKLKCESILLICLSVTCTQILIQLAYSVIVSLR